MTTQKRDGQKSQEEVPGQTWGDFLDQAERQWNAVLNELMASDEFGQASGKMMEALLGLHASTNQATQSYFSILNLPTRSDILSLAERLQTLEERLDEIHATLAALTPQPDLTVSTAASGPKPRRTKKAPTRKRPQPGSKAGATKKKTPPKTKNKARKPAAPRRETGAAKAGKRASMLTGSSGRTSA